MITCMYMYMYELGREGRGRGGEGGGRREEGGGRREGGEVGMDREGEKETEKK